LHEYLALTLKRFIPHQFYVGECNGFVYFAGSDHGEHLGAFK
jgi:hypothetical protein